MKKVKVKRHLRRTKSGPRIVKYHIRKYSQLPKLNQPTIEARERAAFDALSKNKHREYGGLIDFGKNNRMKAFTTQVGEREYVDIPEWEVNWHTHPKTKRSLFSPSPADIKFLVESKVSQASMILQNGKSIVFIKTPKSEKLRNLSEKKIKRLLGEEYDYVETPLRNQLNSLRKLGFKVIYDQKGDIKIPVKVVEPRKSFGNWTTIGVPVDESKIKILEKKRKQLAQIAGDLAKSKEAEQIRKDIERIEGY